MNITLEDALKRCPTKSLREKVEASVKLLRKAERLALAYDKEDGYFLAFSGGKDSQVLFHIAQLSEVKFKAHMSLTTVDPPDVIRFVRKEYPEVEMIKPTISMFDNAVNRAMLPTMRIRWCCADYKEGTGAGKITLTGVRRTESTRRAKRNECEISGKHYSGSLEGLDDYRTQRNKRKTSKAVTIVNAKGEQTLGCIHGKETLIINPILNYTEEEVWMFLNEVVRVPHCCLYDQGFSRIGCLLCPMSSPKQKLREIEMYPHMKRNWLRAIKKIRGGGATQNESISQKRKRKPRPAFSKEVSSDRLNDTLDDEIAENVFDWWISGKGYKQWYADKFLQLKIDFGDSVNKEETSE